MLHPPLVVTTAKLDISLLLESENSPPPTPSTSTHRPSSRSSSVAASSSAFPRPSPSSQHTSASSNLSTATAPTTYSSYATQPYPPPHALPPLSNPSSYQSFPQQPAVHPQQYHLKRPPPTPSHPSASPKKKQSSKWSPEEDALITELRGSGMKWDDISKRLPGRSAISCRLHYQNYLERRSEWDDEKKTRLARLYERLKADMWSPLASELGVPWRAAEAMHWQLGEAEMARRAGVVPFSLLSNPAAAAGVPTPGSTYPVHDPSPGLGPGGPGGLLVDRGLQQRGERGESIARIPAGRGVGERGGYLSQGTVLPSMAEVQRGLGAYEDFLRPGQSQAVGRGGEFEPRGGRERDRR